MATSYSSSVYPSAAELPLAKSTSREIETKCRSIFPFSADEASEQRKVKQLVFGGKREQVRNIKTYKLPALNICDLDAPYLDDERCYDEEDDLEENVLEDIQRDEEADHLGLLRVLNGRNETVQKEADIEEVVPLNLLRVSSLVDKDLRAVTRETDGDNEVLVEDELSVDDDEWTIMDETDDETSSQWTSVTSDFSVHEMNFLTAAQCGPASASMTGATQTATGKGARFVEKTRKTGLSAISEDNGMDFIEEYSKVKGDGEENVKHGKMRRGRNQRRRKNRR